MSPLEAAIPGLLGALLVARPAAMFAGSKVVPDARKLRVMRGAGVVLLAVAALYLLIGELGG